MTDFARIKMGFVVALLAALFMLKPLIDDWSANPDVDGFMFLNVQISVLHVYYLFSALLGFAAYCYAMDMMSKKSSAFVQSAGNTFYALAILVPPFYLAMGLISYLTFTIAGMFESPRAAYFASVVLAVLLGLFGSLFYWAIRRQLLEQDNEAAVDQLSSEQANLMAKANGLLEAGLYDLVLMESFRAVETALKKLLVSNNVRLRKRAMSHLLNTAERHKLISKADREMVHDLRVLRNAVTHENKALTRDDGERVIDVARRAITTWEKSRRQKAMELDATVSDDSSA
jgi:HEPN domain-containing protein